MTTSATHGPHDGKLAGAPDDGTRLSVLMVTYGGDSAAELDAALESLALQTRPADEIVLVRNGPLGDKISEVIEAWQSRIPLVGPVLRVNMPFPHALNAGLGASSGDLVARMDSDDVCRPDRFEVQLAHMRDHPEVDVLGSAIAEFDTDPDTPERVRAMPISAGEIRRMARWRNPMNHMSVMFRRSVVVEAGGYRDLPGFEDYELWVRLMASGRRFENLDENLVAARIGNGFVDRRRGIGYARDEWRAMSAIAGHHLPGSAVIWASMPARFALRCLPASVTEIAYRSLRKVLPASGQAETAPESGTSRSTE